MADETTRTVFRAIYFLAVFPTTVLAGSVKENHNIYANWPVGKSELENGTQLAYMYDRKPKLGSGTLALFSNRLLSGKSPTRRSTAYTLKAKSVTHAGYNPDHKWGFPRIGMISFQGECKIAANNENGHCQGGAFVAKHVNESAHGKLVASEHNVEVKSEESVGPDFWNEPDATIGITINGDHSPERVASTAIKVAGQAKNAFFNGIALKRDRIKTRAFWHQGHSAIYSDGSASFGTDKKKGLLTVKKPSGKRQMTVKQGMVIGDPDSGMEGTGTINAEKVLDDGKSLVNMVRKLRERVKALENKLNRLSNAN